MKGKGLVAKRYLVIVFPFDLLTNQLAESPVTFVISSLKCTEILTLAEDLWMFWTLGIDHNNFEAVQIGFWSIRAF